MLQCGTGSNRDLPGWRQPRRLALFWGSKHYGLPHRAAPPPFKLSPQGQRAKETAAKIPPHGLPQGLQGTYCCPATGSQMAGSGRLKRGPWDSPAMEEPGCPTCLQNSIGTCRALADLYWPPSPPGRAVRAQSPGHSAKYTQQVERPHSYGNATSQVGPPASGWGLRECLTPSLDYHRMEP